MNFAVFVDLAIYTAASKINSSEYYSMHRYAMVHS